MTRRDAIRDLLNRREALWAELGRIDAAVAIVLLAEAEERFDFSTQPPPAKPPKPYDESDRSQLATTARRDRIHAYLTAHPNCWVPTLAKELGLRRMDVQNDLQVLRRNGLVETSPLGWRPYGRPTKAPVVPPPAHSEPMPLPRPAAAATSTLSPPAKLLLQRRCNRCPNIFQRTDEDDQYCPACHEVIAERMRVKT